MIGPNAVSELEVPNGERGIPSLNQESTGSKRRAAVLLGTLLVVPIGVLGTFWKIKNQDNYASADTDKAFVEISSSLPARTFSTPIPEKAEEVESVAIVESSPPIPPLPGVGVLEETQFLDRSSSALMVDQTNVSASQSKQQSEERSTSTATAVATVASRLKNRSFLLTRGAFINCVLKTRLDSTVPGHTACVVTRDMYSDTGKIRLIERGSTISGEYQSNLAQGQERIYVLWDRVKTPDGIVVDLQSSGTDSLGGSGLPGYVETHFWQRFGGALMLSLVSDIARGVANQTNRGSNQINFNGSTGATRNMAAEALRNTINIPPTLYKNQGEEIGIYVARDIDFSSVYDVVSK